MRIVAGSAKGRTLRVPVGGNTIRPTADRVRQTLFNILGQWCEGLSVLDLYAGTGALALEALSRGAKAAVLVDSGREALELCRANAKALGFVEQTQVLASDARKATERLGKEGATFDLIFADPPYAAKVAAEVVAWVDAAGLLAPGGRLCVEFSKEEALPLQVGQLTHSDERRFGDTVVAIFERVAR